MKYSAEFPHPEAGKLVQAVISDCCGTSVSISFGKHGQTAYTSPYYYCNQCKKPCKEQIVDRWQITPSGHYRQITPDEALKIRQQE